MESSSSATKAKGLVCKMALKRATPSAKTSAFLSSNAMRSLSDCLA